MTQPQPTKNEDLYAQECQARKLSNLARGFFFLVSALSLIAFMFMLIFVWQPIWSSGFKDFHTITTAINELNKTAQPASASVPLMLGQMADMNESILDMRVIMRDIHGSMITMERMTPNIEKMTSSVDQMSMSVNQMNTSVESINMNMSTQLSRMAYLIDQMENKLSPFGMMPFNW